MAITMHKDDEKWVVSQITTIINRTLRQTVLEGYKKHYKKIYDAEPLTHRKDGKARRECNNMLRKYIEGLPK